MPIINSGGTILYTRPSDERLGLDTFSFGDEDWSIHDRDNKLKQVKFNVNPTTTGGGSVTIQVDVGSTNDTINLSSVSAAYAFGVIQPTAGTAPTADINSDSLTITSSDNSVVVTGDATTDTLDITVANAGNVANKVAKAGDTMTGQLLMTTGAAVVPIVIKQATSPSVDAFQITDNSNVVNTRISSTGNVGLGMAGSTPLGVLHAKVINSGGSFDDGLVLESRTNSTRRTQLFQDASGFYYQRHNQSTNYIIVCSDAGKIGLGVGSPGAHCDVLGSISSGSAIRIRSGTTPSSPNNGDVWNEGTDMRIHQMGLALNTLGKTIKIKEGANGCAGVATLVAGTVTVSTTAVTANSRIHLTPATAGGTQGFLSYTISAGVSFTINSSSLIDTSTVNWLITEPA